MWLIFSLTKIEAMGLICNYSTQKNSKYIDDSIYDTIRDIAPSLIDVSPWSTWKEENLSILNSVLTEEGLCFAFNALNSHQIYTEE